MNAIRNLQHADLEAMQTLWTRAKYEEIIPGVLAEKCFNALDYSPDLCIGYFKEGDLAGFACGTLLGYENLAGIRLLVVDPLHRRRGVGASLLQELERRLQSAGTVSRINVLAITGNYFLPGIDAFDMESTCFAEKHGYTWKGYAQNLIAQTSFQRNYEHRVAPLENKGYSFHRLQAEHHERAFAFLQQHFPHWEHETRRALLNDPPTVHIAMWKDEVVSVGCSESNNVGTGSLGPLGVHPEHRGGGVGLVVLHRCVDDLCKLGFEKYILGWTNPDLNRFLRREFGAQRQRVCWIYHKEVS